MSLFNKIKVRFRTHKAYFVGDNKIQYLFLNVVNLSRNRNITITHLWLADEGERSTKGYYPINPERPLPITLKPSESWETWVKIKDIPTCINYHYHAGRIRISTGKIIQSKINKNVFTPSFGTVPGGKK